MNLLNRSQAMLTMPVQVLMTRASFSSLRRRLPEWAAAHRERKPNEGTTVLIVAGAIEAGV